MPVPINLHIIGEDQGIIEGSCEIVGREGSILVQSVDHVVELPSDSRGLVSGSRVHRPITIMKEIDKSSPMLYQALCTNELLTELFLNWYRVDETGTQELYFSMLMRNALINKIRPWLPNVMDAESAAYRHMEEVSFIYEYIRWTWLPDGIEFEDSWNAGREGLIP